MSSGSAWPSPPAGELAVGIRPECLTPADDGRPSVEFRVEVVEPMGEQVVVHGTVDGTPVHSGAEEQDAIPLLVEGARRP